MLSREEKHFSCLIADKEADFTKIKQVIVNILEKLGKEPVFKEADHKSFIQGRCASISIKEKEEKEEKNTGDIGKIGVIGEIHPQVLENQGLEVPVCGFEVDLEKIK